MLIICYADSIDCIDLYRFAMQTVIYIFSWFNLKKLSGCIKIELIEIKKLS